MICPVCRLELGIERRAGEVVLTYGLKEWPEDCCCRARGAPALCCKLQPTVLKMLTERQNGRPSKR